MPIADLHDEHTEAWYAVWTHSHCERLVAQQLAAKGFAAFLPEVRVKSARRGVARLAPVPLFPGYVFLRARLDKTRYIEALKVRGIVRILQDGWTRLTPIPDAEIDAIRRVLAANLLVVPHPHLHHGDRVRVIEGPLTGIEGIFIDDKQQKGRLVLSVDLLGRSVSVEIDNESVEPVGSSSGSAALFRALPDRERGGSWSAACGRA